MKKFDRTYAEPSTVAELKAKFAHMPQFKGMPDSEWQKQADKLNSDVYWRNDVYQVAVSDVGPEMWHLSIKRIDKAPIRVWRDFQEIKNQIIGPEHEALELYPAESRLVDTSNQYHLWVFKDPKIRMPFGFNERMVIDGTGEVDPQTGTRQEPLKKS